MAYSQRHLDLVDAAVERSLNYKILLHADYPLDYVEDLYLCLEYNLNPVYINQPRFNHEQRMEIIAGLDGYVNIDSYANPAFSADQMHEIREGEEADLDVSIYADPSIPAEEMCRIRNEMMDIDISEYFDCGYGAEEVVKGLLTGLDVSWYNSLRFTADNRWEIRVGLREGLDVSWYADPAFHFLQMREIRHGLEAGIDVSIYANPDYDFEVMQEIKRGLIQGFDMEAVLYSLPEITLESVMNARTRLAMRSYHKSCWNGGMSQ